MNEREEISMLKKKVSTLMRRLVRVEDKVEPKPEKKRISKYVPKIKMRSVPSKSEIHQRIDNRFLRKLKAA